MKTKLFEKGRPYRDSLQGFREDFQALEQLVDELFEQLHVFRASLASKEKELELVQSQLDDRTRELEHQRSDADSLAAHFDHHDQQLANALRLLEEFKVEASQYPNLNAEGPPVSGAEADRLLASEQQRAALEAELELVRSRAAELQETIFEQKQEVATRSDQLQQDLKYVRTLLEKRVVAAEQLETPAAQRTASEPQANAPRDEPDPVADSIKAQFAKLQQDVAKRRTRRK